MSRRSEAVLLAAAFAGLAGVVAAGWCTGIDQWAIDHLMPGSDFRDASEPTAAEGLVPLLGAEWHGGVVIATNVVTLPAAFLISFAIAALRARILAVALLAAVAVEVLCKEVLVRPALYDGTLHVVPFDSSFPSGHALRTIIVAAAVWPRFGAWTAVWVCASLALLLAGGWHTPTDIAGGVVLGGLAVLSVGAGRGIRSRGSRGAQDP